MPSRRTLFKLGYDWEYLNSLALVFAVNRFELVVCGSYVVLDLYQALRGLDSPQRKFSLQDCFC